MGACGGAHTGAILAKLGHIRFIYVNFKRVNVNKCHSVHSQ